MPIVAEHLHCTYDWTAYPAEDSRLTGEPDEVHFNRMNGHEVLAFINTFLCNHDIADTPENGLRAECIIKESLPSFCLARKTVDMWMAQHWDD